MNVIYTSFVCRKGTTACSTTTPVPSTGDATLARVLVISLRENEIVGKLSDTGAAIERLERLLKETKEQLDRRLTMKQEVCCLIFSLDLFPICAQCIESSFSKFFSLVLFLSRLLSASCELSFSMFSGLVRLLVLLSLCSCLLRVLIFTTIGDVCK